MGKGDNIIKEGHGEGVNGGISDYKHETGREENETAT